MIKCFFTHKRISMARAAIVALFASIIVLPTKATDWSPVFVEGVNSHHSDGEIEFDKGTYLENAPADGILPAHEVDDEDKNACWVSSGARNECTASGAPSSFPDDRLDFKLCESSSNVNLGPPPRNNVPLDIQAGEYADINLSGANRIIRFTTPGGIYKIKNLTASSGTLVFAPGQYWIESLVLNKNVNVLYPSSGTVSWFIKNDYSHKNSSLPYSAEQLLIHNYGNFELDGNNYLRAYVFAEKNITITGNSSVEGAIAGGEDVDLESNSRVIFNDTADSINVTPDCAVTPPATNHYRIEFSSDALSCTAKSITIKSCANDDCSTPSPLPSTVELIKDGEKYSDITFTGETDTQLWHGEGKDTTIGLGATSPTGAYRCYIDSNLVDNTACSLYFAEAGFIVSIDNYPANKPQKKIAISAVKKSDTSTQCVPAFGASSTTRDVNFWSEYINPAPVAIVTGSSASVNGDNIGTSSLSPTPLSLTFNSQGKAEFELNYPDAGKIAIHAKYTAPAGEEDEGLVMEGSDNTVRYPVGLCIKPETVCTAGDDTCPKFKIAGETFNTSIQAMAWELNSDTDYCNYSSATPNYVQAGIALAHTLKQPVDGVLGELGISSYDHDAKADSLNGFAQSISEVGVFTLTATPPNGYLGENINIPSAESQPVGRFYPNDFDLYEESMLATCGTGVTYMDEPTSLMMKIRARNLSGVTTRNYFKDDTVDFASGAALLVAENSNEGINYQSRLSGLTDLKWEKDDQGVQAIESDIQFTRLLDSNLDGPYAFMAIGVQMIDKDGALIASPDMNAETSDDCTISDSCNAKLISTQHYRHGRIVLENAYAPETDTIRMPVTAQYWDGTQWVVNTLDNCTDIATAALPVTDVVYSPALVSPQSVTRVAGTSTVPDSDFAMGRFELLWQSLVATPNRYRGQVTAPLVVPAWLQWYWNYDGDKPNDLYDPRASAFFGTYRGHDRVIQWREVN